ncbi:MAG: hypothetical protein Q9207_000805 [Kuettlingeria erythrocarpa]
MPARITPTVLERYRQQGKPYPYQAFYAATEHFTRATAKNDHPRAPPARPKPLDFPHYQIQGDLNAVRDDAHSFDRLFVDLEKGVSPQHLEALNVSLHGEIPLDQLIPEEYLPPREWLQHPSQASETPKTQQSSYKLSNDFPIPGHGAFYDRVKELLYDMDEAFDVTTGKRSSSAANTIRLGYSHKFYQHLLLMAEYWDTSKDNYTTTSEGRNNKETYTGRRYGASPDMPASFREDTICALVEMCIWPFRCSIQNPRSSVWRKLRFHNRYLPIQGVTSAVCRNSTDRQKARRGVSEGPLMGIHCRNSTTFRSEAVPRGQGREELLDLLFEVGAALLVAQKRAREGKEEESPGKEKYWIDRSKRHLGELGGGQQDRDTDERARREIEAFGEPMEGLVVEEQQEGSSSSRDPEKNGTRKRKQRPGTQAYLDAKAPESTWESKVEYKLIGKEAGAGADKIFLLSSLNHHLSLVSIRVDDRYLDFITHGSGTPGFDPSRQDWWVLEVKRSRWYDLFKAEDRAETMRGIWGAVGWMMRREESIES